MTLKVEVLGWSSQGLRSPDHDLSFETAGNGIHSVSLIQMPNGTGKTTTLRLLRAALSGDVTRIKEPTTGSVMEYRKRAGANGSGEFRLRLRLGGKPYTISIIFDFDNDGVGIKTTRPSGQTEGFHVPSAYARFLRGEFVNFFVFDGELAESLLDATHTNAETALESLYHIDTVRRMRDRLNAHWEKIAESHSATQEKGYTRRINRLSNLEKRLATLLAEKQEMEKLVGALRAQRKLLGESYAAQISRSGDTKKKLSTALAELARIESECISGAATLLQTISQPAALSKEFSKRLVSLKDGLDRVKLPESAAREFFEELAEEDLCICGRPIDKTIAKVIRERASGYLGSDDAALLNTIKTAVGDACGAHPPLRTTLSAELRRYGELLALRREKQNQVDTLKDEAEQEDPDLQAVHEKISDIDRKLVVAEKELEKYDSPDGSATDENTFGIKEISDRIGEQTKKVNEIKEVMLASRRRDISRQILTTLVDRLKRRISEDVTRQTNETLEELLPDNHIRLQKIDRCLRLEGQGGGSVGETLTTAYAFLKTLFSGAAYELPFIVDSPAGAIDLDVRPRVAGVIPQLAHQFVAFVISSERQSFVKPLLSAAGEVQYITCVRKGIREAPVVEDGDTVTESGDGWTVIGRSYFDAFQLDSEESQ